MDRVRAALQAGKDPALVYTDFEISRFGAAKRTFRRWAAMYLREWEDRKVEPEQTRVDAGELLQDLLDSLATHVAAGRKIEATTVDAVRGVTAVLKFDLDREAEKRAGEKHEAWKAEQNKKQAAALDENAESAGLTDEQLAVIKSRVLGI